MHPRLLSTLILLDPVIQKELSTASGGGAAASPARASTFRRDLWPSRTAAVEAFRKSKFYQAWDHRVLDRWLQDGLRDTPTAIYPEQSATGDGENPVTLTTTKHQEVFTFLRPIFEGQIKPGSVVVDRYKHPDADPAMPIFFPFYRPEPVQTYHQLPFLRPSVLYLFGGLSNLSQPEARKDKLELTGSGIGGSGGVKEGRVKAVVLEDIGHLLAMEAVDACADAAAAWLDQELQRWQKDERKFKEDWSKTPRIEKLVMSQEWRRMLGEVEIGSTSGKEKL